MASPWFFRYDDVCDSDIIREAVMVWHCYLCLSDYKSIAYLSGRILIPAHASVIASGT